MKRSDKNNKNNIKIDDRQFLKTMNTRNIFNKFRNNITSKKKFFSISSKEELLKGKNKNSLKYNNPKKLRNIKTKKSTISLVAPKYFSNNISKLKNNFNTIEKSNNIRKTNKILKIESLFKKNVVKNGDLKDKVINNKNAKSHKIFLKPNNSPKDCLNNSKKSDIQPFNTKTFDKNKKNKKNKKNIIIRINFGEKLINFYKKDNIDKDSSIFSETNSLFLNSKIIKETDEINKNGFNIKDDDSIFDYKIKNSKTINLTKRIKDYNKIIDLINININDMKALVNNEDNKKSINNNNDICDFKYFIKNIPKKKNFIKIDNKENVNINSIEFNSFLESSIQEDFYQTLIFNKQLEKIKTKDDTFNLSRSLSEFGGIKIFNKKYDFEKIIHFPKKNNMKIDECAFTENIHKERIKSLNYNNGENNNISDRNNFCNIF